MKKLYLLRGRNCSVLVALLFSSIQLCAWPAEGSPYPVPKSVAAMQMEFSTEGFQAWEADKQPFLLANAPQRPLGNNYLRATLNVELIETGISTAPVMPTNSSYDLEKITYLILAMSLSLNVFLFMRDRR